MGYARLLTYDLSYSDVFCATLHTVWYKWNKSKVKCHSYLYYGRLFKEGSFQTLHEIHMHVIKFAVSLNYIIHWPCWPSCLLVLQFQDAGFTRADSLMRTRCFLVEFCSVCSEFPVYSAEDGGLRKLHQISLLIDLRYLWQWPGAVAPLRRGLRQARGFRLPDITQVPDILLGKMRWPCDGIQHCTPP